MGLVRLDFLTKIDKISGGQGKFYVILYAITYVGAWINSDGSFQPQAPAGVPAPGASNQVVRTVGTATKARPLLRAGTNNFSFVNTIHPNDPPSWWLVKLEHTPPGAHAPIDVGAHDLLSALADPDQFSIPPEGTLWPTQAEAQSHQVDYDYTGSGGTRILIPTLVASDQPWGVCNANLWLYQTGSRKGQTLVSAVYTAPSQLYTISTLGVAVTSSQLNCVTIKADPKLLAGFPQSILQPPTSDAIKPSLLVGISNVGNIMNQSIGPYPASWLIDNVTGAVKRLTPVSTFYPPASTAPLHFNGGPYTLYYSAN